MIYNNKYIYNLIFRKTGGKNKSLKKAKKDKHKQTKNKQANYCGV